MSGKRSALMVVAVVAVAAAAAGVWWARPAETMPPGASEDPKPQSVARDTTTPVAPPDGPPADGPPSDGPPPEGTPLVLPPPEAPPAPTSADFARSAPAVVELTKLPIDALRTRASADDLPAMEELARRLLQGDGVDKDQQAGAGWLLRAADRGSAKAAFNVGVMFERGFVIERDSTRAVEWYRKAVAANLPMAKHNLALLLRDGKGAPRNGKEAVDLLRSATRQGMAASMFALGDIYERGDGATKDQATALAWFAITAEFERQTNRNGESALAKTALQRAQALQRVLLPSDLERAQQIGHSEFQQIVEALRQPPKPPAPALPAATAPATDAEGDPPAWPKGRVDQVRAIQQALIDLKFLRDKPDGAIGPMTRSAIRAFQKSIGVRETGEPTKDLFVALQQAVARAAPSPPPN